VTASPHLKHIIIGTLLLAVPAWFLVNAPVRDSYWPVSVIAILGFSVPVIIGACRWLGVQKGLLLTAVLGVYALLFETFAIKTGWPYGHFSYGGILGPQLFGSTPVTVLVAWTPLMLGALALFTSLSGWRAILSLTGLVVLADIVLDPAAVHVGFWTWDQPGFYYGVPLINFVGWIISAGLAAIALVFLQKRIKQPLPPILGYNFGAILIFWTLVNLFAGQWVAGGIGVIYCFYIIRLFLNRRPTDVTLR